MVNKDSMNNNKKITTIQKTFVSGIACKTMYSVWIVLQTSQLLKTARMCLTEVLERSSCYFPLKYLRH